MGKEALPYTEAELSACPGWGRTWVLIGSGKDWYHGRTDEQVKINWCPKQAIAKGRETVCLGETSDH